MEHPKYNEVGLNEVGSIHLGNQVCITDPCYDITTWCQKTLYNVSPGDYKCFIVIMDCNHWGNRVAELHVVKENVLKKFKKPTNVPYPSTPTYCSIGVDSGQCGIFDANYYEKNQPDNDYQNQDSWYRRVCNLTDNAGIIDNLGVVTSSGYGDGVYDLYTLKDKTGVVAMKVVFIYDNEEMS